MSKHKVVLVDDSALSRKMISEALGGNSEIEVVYSAPGAQLAYGYLEKHPVDLVVLDVEMPRIDGIEAAGTIKARWPSIHILMCSSLTEHGAETTLRALENGASDYIAKPTAKTGREAFAREIHRKVAQLLKVNNRPKTAPPSPGRPRAMSMAKVNPASVNKSRLAPLPGFDGPLEAVAIGCSTGGPPALDELYANIARPFPVPTFIVQHMPPVFTRLLAERLAAKTGFMIKEGEHGEEVRNEVTYVAPGGKHMIVVDRKGRRYIELNEDPMEHSCRPAVDVLFRSLARVYRDRVVCAVLTGMGADGSGGTPLLQQAGSEVMIQDPSTCVVPSMPNASLDAGSVHRIMQLDEIAQRFEQRCAIAFRERKKAL